MRGNFKTGNLTIKYERTGNSATPIFLLQPFPGTEVAFRPLITEVFKTNPDADFINFTLPGLGGRTKLLDKDIQLKIEDYSKIIDEFIKSFKTESFDILACSLGGYMASYMLAKKIINPKKVVLMSPLFDPKKILNHSLKFQRLLLTGAHKLGLPLRALLTLNYVYIWFVEFRKKSQSASNKLIQKAEKDFENTSDKESFYLFDELLKLNKVDIDAYKSKTLVMVGDNDIPDIIDECKKLEKEGFKLKIIKDGTHGYVFLDPVQTARDIVGFLF